MKQPSIVRVLVVDDDSALRREIVQTLRQRELNVDVRELDDGDGVADVIAGLDPDCVFLDHLLPHEDGLTILRQIRSQGMDTPVVFMTGHGGEQLAVNAMKAGATDYLSKSRMDPESICQALRHAVRMRDAERRAEAAMEQVRTNERRLQRLFDATMSGIAILDATGRYVYANRAAEQLLGIQAEQTIAQGPESPAAPWRRVRHGGVPLTNETRLFRRITVSGEPVTDLEMQYTRLDGTEITLSVSGAPLKEPDGSISSIVVSMRETTAERTARESLRESQRALHTLISNVPGAVYRCRYDEHYTMEYLSEGILALSGYEAADLVNSARLPFSDIIHPDDRKRVWSEVSGGADKGEPYCSTYRIITASGEERWIWDRGQGVHGPDGTVQALEGFLTDITERYRAEQAVREREARLQSLVDNLPMDCWARDTEGRGILQNPISRQLWDNFVGKRVEDQKVPIEVQRKWIENNRRVLAGEVLREELEYTINGQARQFYAIVAPIREGDAIRGIIGANIDITELKRAELAVRRSQSLFQQFMNRSPVAAYMKDDAGRYIYVNDTLAQVFKLNGKAWLGKTAREVWSPETADQIERADHTVLSTDEPAELLQTLNHRDEVHTWLFYRYPMTDPAGRRIVAGMAVDITERQLAEQRLRDDQERYRTLFEHSPYGIVIVDPCDGRILQFNAVAHRQLGYSREEYASLRISDLDVKQTPEEAGRMIHRILKTGQEEFETRQRTRNGEIRDLLVSVRKIVLGGRTLLHATQQDVTERNQLRQAVSQAQKLEAIGRLAGGIAHDFNNLLAVIGGYSEALTRRLAQKDPLHAHAVEIQKAAERGAALTQRLLAFSRRQAIEPKVLDLNRIVADLREMLTRTIGRKIEVSISAGRAIWSVRADPGQMEQVILNLALNARDAMPDGGTLAIATANTTLDGSAAELATLPPGRYVQLAVSDTGTGMDSATLAHIFEPFFTTKEGKGTGLGLSIVYGIVRQCGGNITVRSEPGHGTIFTIYLPAHAA